MTTTATETWQPGDPLHDRPEGDRCGEQVVRLMLQVLDEDGARARIIRAGYTGYGRWWCYSCDVGGERSSTDGAICWSCGQAIP